MLPYLMRSRTSVREGEGREHRHMEGPQRSYRWKKVSTSQLKKCRPYSIALSNLLLKVQDFSPSKIPFGRCLQAVAYFGLSIFFPDILYFDLNFFP